MTLEQIRTAALKLEPLERETLAEELLLSINATERQTIDQLWLAEARRRDAAFAAGKMGAQPLDQVLQRIHNKARS